MGEWREYKIGELGEVVTGKTPSSKNREDFGDHMPFVTPSDYKYYNKWAEYTERRLSATGIEKLKGKVLPPKSAMVTCIRSDMGKVALNKVPVITNQQINSIVPNNEIADPDFLYYSLVSEYDTLRMLGQSGTAVPIVNKGDFEDLVLPVPSLPEQRAIASVLSSLDDKVDLLQRQNKTLEKLAETVFRQWFAEGETPAGRVNDLIEILPGFAFKSENFVELGNYRLVTIKNVQDGYLDLSRTDHLQEIPGQMPDYCKLDQGDILLSLTGNVGRCCLVTDQNLLLNQRVAKLQPRDKNNRGFAYTFFRMTATRRLLEELAKGTAQANLSPVETKDLEMPLPDEGRLSLFADKANPLIDKVLLNYIQIRALTQMRDTLLPKLMSGEMRVKPSNEMKNG
jgi:type I restriction enzyme S subunit